MQIQNFKCLRWALSIVLAGCYTVRGDESLLINAEPDSTEVVGSDATLLQELGSEDFTTRMSGSTKLKQLTAKQLSQLIQKAVAAPSAEAIMRLIAEVDDRYASDNAADVEAAASALEMLAEGSRRLSADGAAQSLRQHWVKRVDLVIAQLEQIGATVKRGEFAGPNGQWPPQKSSHMQVLLDEDWKGGDSGIALLRRFTDLIRATGHRREVVVYLIMGHPLSEQQEVSLRDAVGHDRVAVRSAVALGISSAVNEGTGVLIANVLKGGSAQLAKLNRGDRLTAIEVSGKDKMSAEERTAAEKKEPLRDFDDLVERLKKYRKGDVLTVRVIRGPFSPRQPQDRGGEETVEVTLKGWADMQIR